LGLIFLQFADNAFTRVEAELKAQPTFGAHLGPQVPVTKRTAVRGSSSLVHCLPALLPGRHVSLKDPALSADVWLNVVQFRVGRITGLFPTIAFLFFRNLFQMPYLHFVGFVRLGTSINQGFNSLLERR
jgi:hypothetical protein